MSSVLKFPPPKPEVLWGGLGYRIARHWREHRPKMVAELQKAKRFQEAVYAAQERTSDAITDLMNAGQTYDQAWEQVREEWALLRARKTPRTSGSTR
jgi:hypothetical protein